MGYTAKAYGRIVWLGNYGSKKYAKSRASRGAKRTIAVRGPVGTTEVANLRSALLSYSDCTSLGYTWNYAVNIYGVIPPASGLVSVARCAVIYAKAPNGQIVSLTIPGIKDSYLEAQGEGKRVKPDDVTAIVALWSTARGETLIPLYGTFIDED